MRGRSAGRHDLPDRRLVGVDLGVSARAARSTGETIGGPKTDAAAQNKLRRLSQPFGRQMAAAEVRTGIKPVQPIPPMRVPWATNMPKPQPRMAKLHVRIVNMRGDAWHQLTAVRVERFDGIAITELNVAGMLKNHHLACVIAEIGSGEFRRQLEYKAAPHGTPVVIGNGWYPRSKTGSACGYKMPNLPLAVRAWTCPPCQTHPDRDINAAIHCRQVGWRLPTRSGVSRTAR